MKRAVLFLVCLALPLAAAGAAFRLFHVPTGSMANTIQPGDRLLVRLSTALPERNEILVVRYPVDPRQYFIERVVGLPGDRIRLVKKRLWVNGKEAAEPWAQHSTCFFDDYRDNFPAAPPASVIPERGIAALAAHVVNGEFVVPAGQYFVLGDNRDNSLDSRYWGLVDASHIAGRPVLRYYSGQSKRLTWERLR